MKSTTVAPRAPERLRGLAHAARDRGRGRDEAVVDADADAEARRRRRRAASGGGERRDARVERAHRRADRARSSPAPVARGARHGPELRADHLLADERGVRSLVGPAIERGLEPGDAARSARARGCCRRCRCRRRAATCPPRSPRPRRPTSRRACARGSTGWRSGRRRGLRLSWKRRSCETLVRPRIDRARLAERARRRRRPRRRGCARARRSPSVDACPA